MADSPRRLRFSKSLSIAVLAMGALTAPAMAVRGDQPVAGPISPAATADQTAPSCCGKSFVVSGVGGHQGTPNTITVVGAPDPQTADEDFSDAVWGPNLTATVTGLAPGKYTVLIDCMETRYRQSGKRVFDITCDGRTIAKDLDLLATAGFAHAYRISTTVSNSGQSPLVIAFHATKDVALFSAIHVRDALGNGVACVRAALLQPLQIKNADKVPDIIGPVKYKDPSLPAAVRAADLVARMSLSEKVAQMQNAAPAIPRLEVPQYDYWSECLHGIARAGYATVFPEPIGMAATFDPALVHDVAETISTEGRAKYNDAQLHNDRSRYHGLTYWTPNINIFRDPRWGRGQETYGEDPQLSGRFGVAFITGLQGNDPHYFKLVATAKHFAVHSGPEPLRHEFNVNPSPRDLYETYLPQFEAAVREGHVDSVMGAYNAVYGDPCNASPLLLDQILRKTWGFDGYVVSDCDAIEDIWLHHHAALLPAFASAMAVKAGCDLNCGSDYSSLVAAVNAHLIDVPPLDQSLVRLFTARFRLGMFDPPAMVPFNRIGIDQNCTPAHAALAKKVADESITLLKNDGGALPLDRSKLHTIALVGPNLDTWTAFYGNYNGIAESAPTLLESLRAKLGDSTRIIPVRGCVYAPTITPAGYEILPDVCLRHDGDQPGLKAEYFTNPDLAGAPLITRTDFDIDFDYRDAPLLAGYPLKDTSARWTGQFVAPADGQFALAIQCTERVRLWINNKLAIDAWKAEDRDILRAALPPLHKGETADLRLEYGRSDQGWARMALFWDKPNFDLTPLVVDRVKDADQIIFASGINGDIEGEEGERRRPLVGFVDGDRAQIELPAVQEHLIQALSATGKPVVVVNFSGSAMAMPWEAEHVPAILQAWYPGQAGGAAVVDALLGDTNPAGRLPITFYRSTDDLPAFTDYDMSHRTYRYFTGKPLWAFGHGLSYTRFAYAHPVLAQTSIAADGTVAVSVDITNTGSRDGEEVAQVYARPAVARPGDAIRSLRAVARTAIAAGQTRQVTLSFPAADLRHWDDGQHRYVVDGGDYQLQIGGASDDLPLTVTEHVTR